jgi:hypothetical protein
MFCYKNSMIGTSFSSIIVYTINFPSEHCFSSRLILSFVSLNFFCISFNLFKVI